MLRLSAHGDRGGVSSLRALGIDFGSKRIGVAVGVSEPMVTTARPPLTPTGTLAKDAAAIVALAQKEEADAVVVGIPENPDDPRMANVCRKLAESIRALGLNVAEVDEAMSSVEAEANLLETELTAAGRRKLRDGEAARIILERYFEAQA